MAFSFELHREVKHGNTRRVFELLRSGAEINEKDRSGHTPLMYALRKRAASVELVERNQQVNRVGVVSLHGGHEWCDAAIGADIDRKTECGTALGSVHNREIALRLLDAGADPAELSFRGRRAMLGLEPEPDVSLFDATPEDYRLASRPCWGNRNPELLDRRFWQAMIRSGINAYEGAELSGGTRDDCPVWCAQRFGQSLTLLPDGRAIQIAGEHEDHYDPDFYIYNDVFVHHPDGRIDVFCYPKEAFPPTDFHTATLIGDSIYIIGSLGYPGSRRFGEMPVYRLDTNTLQINRVNATGDAPGWISRHRAVLAGSYEIRVWGGKICAVTNDKETYEDNHESWVLDTSLLRWTRQSAKG